MSIIVEDTHISKWVRDTGRLDHDQNTLPILKPFIKPGDWVIDGGAFIGDHTIAYLDWVGPEGKVFAFEPSLQAFTCLTANCPKAVRRCCGLSDVNHKAKQVSDAANVGASYLVKDESGDDCITIDSLNLERLDFIKLDIEGWEYRALNGAYETIFKHRPVMCLEINRAALARQRERTEDVYNLLFSWRYVFQPIWPTLKIDDEQLDILCVPSERYLNNYDIH